MRDSFQGIDSSTYRSLPHPKSLKTRGFLILKLLYRSFDEQETVGGNIFLNRGDEDNEVANCVLDG